MRRSFHLIDRFTWFVFGTPSACALCGSPLGCDFASQTVDCDGERGWPGFRGKSSASWSSGICPACLQDLRLQMQWVCQVCGMPVRRPLTLCPDCRKNLYYFDAQRSCGAYDGNLKHAIVRMKYYGERWLSRPLGGLLAETAIVFLPVDLVVPVPLGPESRLERGFNQALDLAVEVSGKIGVPVYDILKRERGREHQAALGRHLRWSNLQGTMVPKRPEPLTGKTVLLIDDVTTTGATLDEAARVLKGLGAAKVYCVTLARTVRR